MRPTTADRSGHDPLSLDPSTAGRLLDGLAADDAPAAYSPVAMARAARRGPAEPGELTGESAAVAAFAAVGPQPVKADLKGSGWLRSRTRLKVAVATFVGGLTMTTGLAAAGALPGAAQSIASEALERVGISVPNPSDKAGDHPDTRGSSADNAPTEAPDSSTTESGDSGPKADTHGAEVSNTARTTDAEGRAKGAEVSGVASDGKSQAGQGQGAPEDPGVNGDNQADERKPEATPEPPAPAKPAPPSGKGAKP